MTIPKPGDELTLRNGWPAKVLTWGGFRRARSVLEEAGYV